MFELSEYSVNEEDQQVEVCVILLGSIEVNVTVIVSAEEHVTLPENMKAHCR